MSAQNEPRGSKPIVEWILGLGVIVGSLLPWIEAGPLSLSGWSIATIEMFLGKVPGDVGLLALLFLLMVIITLLLPLSPKAWWARAITVVLASGLFGITVMRMGENAELAAKLGAARPGLGILVTGGFLFLLLLVTVVSVIGESIRRRKSAAPPQPEPQKAAT